MGEPLPQQQESAPVPKYQYDQLSPTVIANTVEATVANANTLVAEIIDAAANPTYDTTIGTIDQIRDVTGFEGDYGRYEMFFAAVHPDKAVRDAANEGQQRLQSYSTDLFSRSDIYDVVAAFAQGSPADASSEEGRLTASTLRQFERTGQKLSPEDKAKLKELLSDVNTNCSNFLTNVNSDQTSVDLSPEELEGLSEDFINSLNNTDGQLHVSVQRPPQINTILQQAKRRDVREKVWRAFNSVAMDRNPALIIDTVKKRQQIATLLGYESWAELQLEETMAGDVRTVNAFQDSLKGPLLQKAQAEVATMEPLLHADGYDGPIQAYDTQYYAEKIRQKEFGVDAEKISEYLPLDAVIEGMFTLTGKMYGLEYEELHNVPTWHEDVRTFAIKNSGGDRLGIFHFDPYSRDFKVPGFVTFTLEKGHRLPSGEYNQPEMALVGSLTPPTADKPCLVRPDELNRVFHEFGHVLHGTLARTETVRYGGTSVEKDFVEAPSQIMEHWAGADEIVQTFARHYQTGELIPSELIKGLAASKNVTAGLDAVRYIQLGVFDMLLHDASEPKDLDAIYKTATAFSGTPIIEGTSWISRFVHIFNGYDARYYGYLWAREKGDDMFTPFAKKGLQNPSVGQRYRHNILDRGGSVPAATMMREYLHRASNEVAFLGNLGIRGSRLPRLSWSSLKAVLTKRS